MMLVPETPAMFQRAGMMSPDGRCKTLDASANGYVRAESVAVTLLQDASNFEEDINSSRTCAFIAGTAVNQGGRSSTLTAPNGPSQQEVIRNALLEAKTSPQSIGGLQLHGTGTPLGDPIEIGAIGAVLIEQHHNFRERNPLSVMASKSWIGHSEPAAGLVGCIHSAASLTNDIIPGITHLRELNSYVVSSIVQGTLELKFVGLTLFLFSY